MRENGNLKGLTFLVTGGASGLGLATVTKLVELGANVGIFDLNEEAGKKVAKEFNAKTASERVLFFKTDVTSEESVSAGINELVSKYGQLNGAVNCAGVGYGMKTASSRGAHPLKGFKFVVDINLVGTFNVCRLAAQQMIKQDPIDGGDERGVLINTASVAAFEGQVGQVAYAASKGGVVGMTIVMARDLGRYGIRSMTIAPGVFETPMFRKVPDAARNRLVSMTEFPKRLGYPEEFGSMVVSIVRNKMLNGSTIRLDAGIRMAAM